MEIKIPDDGDDGIHFVLMNLCHNFALVALDAGNALSKFGSSCLTVNLLFHPFLLDWCLAPLIFCTFHRPKSWVPLQSFQLLSSSFLLLLLSPKLVKNQLNLANVDGSYKQVRCCCIRIKKFIYNLKF